MPQDIDSYNRISISWRGISASLGKWGLKYVPPSTTYDLAMKIMAEAEGPTLEKDLQRALRYRDGLMIAILAARAPRRSNFAAIEIGRHLTRDGDQYHLCFPGEEMKNGRPWEAPLPDPLTPYIDSYLERHRPYLLNGRKSNNLWITYEGNDMAEGSIYDRGHCHVNWGVRRYPL